MANHEFGTARIGLHHLVGAPAIGTISVGAVDSDESDAVWMTVSGYTTPTTLSLAEIGQAPQVLELASYPAILACVAGGRCAGVVPEAVVDLLHTPPALRWVPLGPCDTVLVHRTGYATPALAALQAALHGAQDTPSVLAPESSLRS